MFCWAKERAMNKQMLSILWLVVRWRRFTPITVHADMSPPQLPPGTNIVPGREMTQCAMVAENGDFDMLTIISQVFGQAATEAVFTMRNLSQ